MFLNRYINTISGLQLFQLFRFGTLLLISIVFAKSHYSTEAIGNYELFLFIAALLCSFWINGLIQAFLPLYRNNSSFGGDAGRSPVLFNVFILISFLSVLVIAVLISFRDVIGSILGSSGEIPFFNLLVLYVFFSCPAFLIEYIYLLQDKPKSIIVYGLTTFAGQLILVAVPAVAGYAMETAIGGFVVLVVIRYVWLLVLLKKYAAFRFSIGFMKEHLHVAWPLIVSALLGSSASYVDGFLVMNYFDSSTFAVFRYGARELPLVVLMANALSNAMLADFSDKRRLKEALDVLKRRSRELMNVLFPLTILFLICSRWLYPRVFNPDFLESAVVFNIYLLLIFSRLVFPHTILIGMKKNSIVLYASVAELVVNVILSLVFIGWWGIEGVAFATVIAFTVQKGIWMIYNKVVLNIPPGQYIPLRHLVVYSSIVLFVFVLMY